MIFALLLLGAVQEDGPSPKMLGRKPVMELTSGQSADAVQQCVGLALQGIGRPIVTRFEGGRYVGFGKMERTPALISIFDGQPVRIEVRQWLGLNHRYRNRIRFCAS